MVDVVGDPHGDAAGVRPRDRVHDRRGNRGRQREVVERDVERVLRLIQERGELRRDVRGLLTAVGQRGDLKRH